MPSITEINFLNKPVDYSSAHGDLVYVVIAPEYNSNPSAFVNFKFIMDLFIDGNRISTLKAFPAPTTHYGVFNIGNIIRNYVNSDFNPSGFLNQQDFLNSSKRVTIQIGVEWGIPITEYTNIVNTAGRFYNHYNGRLSIGNYTILDRYINRWVTNRPNFSKVIISEKDRTTNLLPVLFEGGDDCDTFDSHVYLQILLPDGSVDVDYTSDRFTYFGNSIKEINVTPYLLNDLFGSNIDETTYGYRVKIYGKDKNCENVETEWFTFIIDCEPKYKTISLCWLNKLGGFDTYDFSKVSKKGYDSEKKSYNQLQYKIRPQDGLMTYYNGFALNDNQITYNSTFKERLIVNTDIINEETYAWLAELIVSPQIYIYENGFYIPVIVKDTNYDFKTKVIDRTFNLTVNLQYADTLNAQYR
ncbi:hypothetical protein UFOVP208_46 [uncultured Caudovirales phage]|uniref:Uncharacterized protein n=1 Tax=uncultured Caudovirales phage TaxID=2100421 RepID=A0A6J7WPK6_9CAUD|nr:hypothetical protein UFOVP208_46 [uncultured Caudovirales phage]